MLCEGLATRTHLPQSCSTHQVATILKSHGKTLGQRGETLKPMVEHPRDAKRMQSMEILKDSCVNRKKPDPLIYILASERQELRLAVMYIRKGQETLAPPETYDQIQQNGKIDLILSMAQPSAKS